MTIDNGNSTNRRKLQQRTAKIYNIDKYDEGYFGVHYRQADVMDPVMKAVIMDTRLNPLELQGTKTVASVDTCWLYKENTILVNTVPMRLLVSTRS